MLSHLAVSAAESMDGFRSSLLRLTLSNGILRSIYRNRAQRLFALYCLAVMGTLTLAIFFPLYVLIFGPIIYGFPHLFASIRYVHYSVSEKPKEDLKQRRSAFRFFTLVLASVAGIRILTDIVWKQSFTVYGLEEFPEYISVIFTFLGCAFIYRKSLTKILLGTLVLSPFLYCAWVYPLYTAGVTVLTHNLVAFIYWVAAAKNSQERLGAITATLIFCGVNITIFMGVFDPLYQYLQPAGYITWAGLDYYDLGRFIAPWTDSTTFWFHCVVAYAFGQSQHYFVWLKAIPDQHHQSEAPTSFRQSFRLLSRDFGGAYTTAMILFLLATVGLWVFVSLPEARALYFAVAAYHGFLEIAGLGFLKFRHV